MRSTLSNLLLCAALPLSLMAGGALAQSPAKPSQKDLVALVTYYDQGDAPSVNAEMRRLQLKFPDWVPPKDIARLKNRSPSTEIDAIYKQIEFGRLASARSLIESTRRDYPDWTPQDEMITLLETAEGQAQLDNALMAGNAAEAIQVVSRTPSLLRCDRINNAWRIAEVQAQRVSPEAAAATFGAIVDTCTEFPAIVATLQKADAATTYPIAVGLIDRAKTRFEDEEKQLEELKIALALGRGLKVEGPELSDSAIRKRPRARPMPGEPSTDAPRQAAPAAPRVAQSSPSRRSRDTAPASTQYASAPTPSTGGGVLGQVRAAAKSGAWSRCLALSAGATAPAVVYERGWCSYNLGRPMEALASFKQAAGANLGGTVQRDARFGMALSYLKMNMTEQAAQVVANTNLTHQQRVDTETIILDQRGVAAYQKRDYARAVQYFNAIEKISGGLRRDLGMLRAYAYFNMGKRDEARDSFEVLNNQMSTQETRHALQSLE
ncbi:hypothetical protein GLS40_00140 [Pseudooceanicola sp. 216_PA32_1]|uniref:Tetratricopeptide repeat protein n=1 Tax=Pseudooceanicola pacificus TaxID=2676438 RepID=A0A844W6U1_9RHOB|nr:tetratricopeptide repeat protein [Pseudooceanicola pacificus]MWB76423.1 hypothetical protein [Pseudooceanicola pacificus]